MGVGIMVGLSVGLCFGVGIWFGLLGMGLLAGGLVLVSMWVSR